MQPRIPVKTVAQPRGCEYWYIEGKGGRAKGTTKPIINTQTGNTTRRHNNHHKKPSGPYLVKIERCCFQAAQGKTNWKCRYKISSPILEQHMSY